MQLIMHGKNVRTLLFLTGVTLMSGCGGGSSDKEEIVEEPRFNTRGYFYRISHDSEKDQALYYDTYVSTQERQSANNLARWEKQDKPKPVDILSNIKVREGNGRVTSGSAQGAVEPESALFFLMGPGKGLTFYLRKALGDEAVDETDLTGTYSCMRQETRSGETVQWFQAEFAQGSFSYTTETGSYLAEYELEEDGRLRILSDSGLSISAEAVSEEFEKNGVRMEPLLAGGFQPRKSLVMASYMIGEAEPYLGESLDGKRPKGPEVTTHGLLICMKGGASLRNSDLQGEYWFGHMSSAPGNFQNAFGYIRSDGQGRLSRAECSHSSRAVRHWEMEYSVNSAEYDGSLMMNTLNDSLYSLEMKGVMSADGGLALLMTEENNGIDILVKKRGGTGCPIR